MDWSDVWCLCDQSEAGGAAGGWGRAPGGEELGPGGGGGQRLGGRFGAWRRGGPGGGPAAVATLRVAEAAEVSGRTGALPAELLAELPGQSADRDRGSSGRSADGVPRRQRALRHDGLRGRTGWRRRTGSGRPVVLPRITGPAHTKIRSRGAGTVVFAVNAPPQRILGSARPGARARGRWG
jgi:hypothetical protein